MWQAVLGLVSAISANAPSIVTTVENIFHSKSKSGAQKAVTAANFFAPVIAASAQEFAKLAPAGSNADAIAASITKYTRAVNDAAVALANDLNIFPHSDAPAAPASN